eukprot:g16444.t2
MLDKTQFYDPSACDAGWSQWDTFCYRFHLDMKTWLDAENVCRASNAHLASIHSAEENSFVHHLANGLKVWIGYNGLKNELHSWSDHTQDDFTNFAKNCTDRAHEAECQPQQVQQWWYNSHAEERSPFVCKRSANVRTARVLKVSAERLLQEDWVQLRTMDPQLESSIGSSKAANASTNSSKECLPDEWSLSANLVKSARRVEPIGKPGQVAGSQGAAHAHETAHHQSPTRGCTGHTVLGGISRFGPTRQCTVLILRGVQLPVVLQGDDPAPPPMPSAPSSPKVAQPASASPACPAPAAAAPVAPAATAAPATRAAPAASASAAEKPPSARANRRASIMSDSISEQSSGGLAGRKPPTPLSLDGTSAKSTPRKEIGFTPGLRQPSKATDRDLEWGQ